MSQKMNKALKQILHPYMFVLKEGVEFREDCLDYSLMMLHVNCLEILASPNSNTLPVAEMAMPLSAASETSQPRP